LEQCLRLGLLLEGGAEDPTEMSLPPEVVQHLPGLSSLTVCTSAGTPTDTGACKTESEVAAASYKADSTAPSTTVETFVPVSTLKTPSSFIFGATTAAPASASSATGAAPQPPSVLPSPSNLQYPPLFVFGAATSEGTSDSAITDSTDVVKPAPTPEIENVTPVVGEASGHGVALAESCPADTLTSTPLPVTTFADTSLPTLVGSSLVTPVPISTCGGDAAGSGGVATGSPLPESVPVSSAGAAADGAAAVVSLESRASAGATASSNRRKAKVRAKIVPIAIINHCEGCSLG